MFPQNAIDEQLWEINVLLSSFPEDRLWCKRFELCRLRLPLVSSPTKRKPRKVQVVCGKSGTHLRIDFRPYSGRRVSDNFSGCSKSSTNQPTTIMRGASTGSGGALSTSKRVLTAVSTHNMLGNHTVSYYNVSSSNSSSLRGSGHHHQGLQTLRPGANMHGNVNVMLGG